MLSRCSPRFVALSTAVLIFAGGLVTSTGSGLSVPDWPNTYGWFMFTFPLEKMVGGIFYEHTHRLIASTVGFLILVLAVWLWRAEPRAWVRRLGFSRWPPYHAGHSRRHHRALVSCRIAISIAHAEPRADRLLPDGGDRAGHVAGWKRATRGADSAPDDRVLQQSSPWSTTAWIYVQILVGATMRHTDAGLAIPDFPLAFGQLIPPHWDAKIAIHFAHRVGALIATCLILATTGHVFYHHGARPRAACVPSILLLVLLAVQITLGALTVLSGKHYIINSLHVVTGASVLVTSLVLTLRAHRARFVGARSRIRRARLAPGSAERHGRTSGTRQHRRSR